MYIVCKRCADDINIYPRVRELDGFKVYSFYNFSDISFLLSFKYCFIGSRVYGFLSKKAFGYLRDNVENFTGLYGIAIDDKINSVGYSHSAIFLSYLKCVGIKPIYSSLLSQNSVTYAGKSLEFRQNNPRDFKVMKNLNGKDIVLIDDIVTTGTTINEARKSIGDAGGNAIMAFTLSDARH